ncbi:MAG TPA: hypothetical protein HA230_00165 [Candidatus Aenigmarchaeota archaeon]|nr:hypothetical protein [Candidatus Aenigmarchaeota archaeon]
MKKSPYSVQEHGLFEDVDDRHRVALSVSAVRTKYARDESREKRSADILNAVFRKYSQWCTERGFPMRENEFKAKYPAAYRTLTAVDSWANYVAERLKSDVKRARIRSAMS